MRKIEYDTVIVRFSGEIGIKSPRVRPKYERKVCKQIKRFLSHYKIEYKDLMHVYGRAYIFTDFAEETAKVVARVFGVSSTSPAIKTSSNMEDIIDLGVSVAEKILGYGETFAIKCRRAGEHPYTSMDVCRKLGEAILSRLSNLNLKVDLENPKRIVNVEVRDDKAYVYTEVFEGVGGFPHGSQGKVVCLLSGGIDSPVACWLIMKRGCTPIFIHFDNKPFTEESNTKKALRLAEKLMEWMIGFKSKIYIIPHGENLAEILEKCPRKLTCIICKRLMY